MPYVLTWSWQNWREFSTKFSSQRPVHSISFFRNFFIRFEYWMMYSYSIHTSSLIPIPCSRVSSSLCQVIFMEHPRIIRGFTWRREIKYNKAQQKCKLFDHLGSTSEKWTYQTYFTIGWRFILFENYLKLFNFSGHHFFKKFTKSLKPRMMHPIIQACSRLFDEKWWNSIQ